MPLPESENGKFRAATAEVPSPTQLGEHAHDLLFQESAPTPPAHIEREFGRGGSGGQRQ